MARPPLGQDDFRKVRAERAQLVDKSRFIADVLESPAEVLLFCRPRRFGKSLNLSMLRYFLEPGLDHADLFGDLAVWADEPARARAGAHPVVFLSIKEAKARDWPTTLGALGAAIGAEVVRHDLVRTLSGIDATQAAALAAGTADPVLLAQSLRLLTRWLSERSGSPVWVLIDEYDAPVHAGFAHGYFDEVVDFSRRFLGNGLKGNPHLGKAVLTGVLRIAKEGLFSSLNQVAVFTLAQRAFAGAFGFTEAEVANLRLQTRSGFSLDALREWYDGYPSAVGPLYNPWSVAHAFALPDEPLQPHWVATGANDALQPYLLGTDADLTRDVEAWLAGETLTRAVSEAVLLRAEIRRSEDVRALLVHTGYLAAEAGDGPDETRLRIPNRDVRAAFHAVARSALAVSPHATRQALEKALLAGDAEGVEQGLQGFVERAMSYLALGGDDPERTFQAFVLGLLVELEATHAVRSERESGFGRADVLVTPRTPGLPGVVLELKKLRDREDPEVALADALAQIATRRYAAELADAGARPVHSYAVVFVGKRVLVRSA